MLLINKKINHYFLLRVFKGALIMVDLRHFISEVIHKSDPHIRIIGKHCSTELFSEKISNRILGMKILEKYYIII